MSPNDFSPSDADRTVQQRVVLAALQAGPADTQQLRDAGIAHPAGRVMELRRQGWPITTAKRGRFALYRLAIDAATGAAGIVAFAAFAAFMGATQAGGLAP